MKVLYLLRLGKITAYFSDLSALIQNVLLVTKAREKIVLL